MNPGAFTFDFLARSSIIHPLIRGLHGIFLDPCWLDSNPGLIRMNLDEPHCGAPNLEATRDLNHGEMLTYSHRDTLIEGSYTYRYQL